MAAQARPRSRSAELAHADLLRVAHHQELDAGQRLRAVQLESVRLQFLNARRTRLGAELHSERVQRREHGRQDDLLVLNLRISLQR